MTTFKASLRSLGYEAYSDYLKSPHWVSFKNEYRESGLSMCCTVCGQKKIQLHHHTYIRLGKELLTDVTPLCRFHHGAVHEWLKESGRIFVTYSHEAIAFLTGIPTISATKKPKQNKHKKQKKLSPPKVIRTYLPSEKQLKKLAQLNLAEIKKQSRIESHKRWCIQQIGQQSYDKLCELLPRLYGEQFIIANAIAEKIYYCRDSRKRMGKFVSIIEKQIAESKFTMSVEGWFPIVKRDNTPISQRIKHDGATSWKSFLKERCKAKHG